MKSGRIRSALNELKPFLVDLFLSFSAQFATPIRVIKVIKDHFPVFKSAAALVKGKVPGPKLIGKETNQVEKQIMKHLTEFGELKAAEVMIPRADIVAVKQNISLEELRQKFIETSFTRLPLCKQNLDEIIGFIHVKDFLPYIGKNSGEVGDFSTSKIARKLTYAARSTKCPDLLTKMRVDSTPIAIILDEYGGTEGLVTLELLIEKIIGDIRDEHDQDRPAVVILEEAGENTYIVDAKLPIQEIEERLGRLSFLSEEEGEYETIGGFLLSYLNRIPEQGEKISHPAGAEIEVLDANPRRVKRIKLTLLPGYDSSD